MKGFGAGSVQFGDLGGSGNSEIEMIWRFLDESPDRNENNQEGQFIGTSLDTYSAPDWMDLQVQGGCQVSGGLSSSVAMPVVLQGDCFKQNSETFDARAVQMGASFDCTVGVAASYGSLVNGSESLKSEDARHRSVSEDMKINFGTFGDVACISENLEIFGSQVANSEVSLSADNSFNNDGAYFADCLMDSPPTNFKYENRIPNLSQLSDHMHYRMPGQEVACFKYEQVGEGGKSFYLNEAVDRKYFVGNDEENGMDTLNTGLYKDGAEHNARISATIIRESSGVNSLEQSCRSSEVGTSGEMEPHCVKDEKEIGEPTLPMDTLKECSLGNTKDCRNNSHVDGGSPDLCIIKEASQPATSNKSLSSKTEADNSQHPKRHHDRAGSMNNKLIKNDRLYRRVAIQDFSQPKSESTPPEGVLAVPLLRHQRIALSWMISQETANLYCSGGILADDQGLGKTVSTIALILKERPPSVRACVEDAKKVVLETLNLDDDDDNNNDDDNKADGCQQLVEIKQESGEKEVNGSSNQRSCLFRQAKGRPAAGTLVVCPTSVLMQWADELGTKVTSEANLSVLLYHGKRRTKNPDELAKYDVVLTTYSIVSMEFPKQPSFDEDGDEKERSENDDTARTGLLSSKKRKSPTISNKRGVKLKNGVESLLLDSVSGPLAKVAWFRVVLDEAQSIKNHRTQVARACWSLRAKRRWCLSGTPIQNAVDDLYSYFRFLRCDRYATYKEFCSRIKNEISRNPSKGYVRLRAILKLIMLRRTKGTLLDGQPIISLPPKVVELRKVEFSKEERDFYTRLESETFAQFKEYAAAGTVKENYVNILLMLLRLRQACDHPALVNGSDSRKFSYSVLTEKKLPRKKQIRLLRCLGASLALCTICSDPPEDAVVTICGHVFCNQCISEHLIGDDKQCPAVNCKVQLSPSSVFSKATLEGSRSEEQVRDGSHEGFVSVEGDTVGPCSETKSYESAKIKEAIQVLQSFVKPQVHTSTNGGETSTHFQSGGCHGSPGKWKMETCEILKDTVKVIGDKAIVFSQWTRMLDLFETGLKHCSIKYRRLDGTMSVAARDRAVRDFCTLPEVSVIIMSLKAASLGLNLVAASHVLLLDLWWNPTTEDQAIDRAHRIGQTRPVTVLRLTVKDTIEDRILALQKKKRKMVASAFGEDGRGTGSRQTSRFTVDDLQFLFSG